VVAEELTGAANNVTASKEGVSTASEASRKKRMKVRGSIKVLECVNGP